MCDCGVRQIFSDEFLYVNDSKRFSEKCFGTSFESNHYRTGTSLKIYVERQDHTVNALLFRFCKFDPKKSRENAKCTVQF